MIYIRFILVIATTKCAISDKNNYDAHKILVNMKPDGSAVQIPENNHLAMMIFIQKNPY